MKYVLFILSVVLLLNCKTKKETGNDANKFMPTEKELGVAQKTWSNTTLEELKEGHSIYRNQCTECHKNFVITKFSEKKWKKEIEHMSKKAKLTDEQKDKLSKFILSYREANTVVSK